MEEVSTVVLENGLEYMEMDKVLHEGITYILLVNCKNFKDFCVRKIVSIDGQEYLCSVDNEIEYNKVLNLFVKKNKILFYKNNMLNLLIVHQEKGMKINKCK